MSSMTTNLAPNKKVGKRRDFDARPLFDRIRKHTGHTRQVPRVGPHVDQANTASGRGFFTSWTRLESRGVSLQSVQV